VQAAEKAIQQRSQSRVPLNVHTKYASGPALLAALLADFLSSLFTISNIKVFFDADIPFAGVAENRDDVLASRQFLCHLLSGEHIGA
jgi:hypothetical protein